jgi:uncharacterized protein
MNNLSHPFGFDATGRTRVTTPDDHVRDLVGQVLLTSPGERVNRPQFGSGLRGLVFEPNGDALAAATRARVEGALQLWLADRIEVEGVHVRGDEATLEVAVQYVVRMTQERHVEHIRAQGVG